MSYQLKYAQMNEILEKLSEDYDIWAPKRIPKAGRYSDTDIIRYEKCLLWKKSYLTSVRIIRQKKY